MARSRNIKPGFFMNDELAELPPLVRLLAIGLPCISDREGRIKDRPKRIKAELLPYDEININDALSMLNDAGYITRYEVRKTAYIQVVNFTKHQNPHVKEPPSIIPAPDKHDAKMPDSLNLIPDSLIYTSNARFDDWWSEYPKKVEKKKARAIWTRRKLDRLADQIIADTKERKQTDGKWSGGFIPNPTTYLNGDRWEDEITPIEKAQVSIPREDSACIAFAAKQGIHPKPGESMWNFRARVEQAMQPGEPK